MVIETMNIIRLFQKQGTLEYSRNKEYSNILETRNIKITLETRNIRLF